MNDIDRFYFLIQKLEDGLGGKRLFGECDDSMKWPKRGVYFLFEPREHRHADPSTPRVTLVGTHAIKHGGKTTLWNRLRTHKGTRSGNGNHRNSVFRSHLGLALNYKYPGRFNAPEWGNGRSAEREIRIQELELEKMVSKYIGKFSILWLAVLDEPSPQSDREYIKKNTIALLSNHMHPIDSPSPDWLGNCSPNRSIRKSGLWNVIHVDQDYDPAFLDIMAAYVSKMLD